MGVAGPPIKLTVNVAMKDLVTEGAGTGGAAPAKPSVASGLADKAQGALGALEGSGLADKAKGALGALGGAEKAKGFAGKVKGLMGKSKYMEYSEIPRVEKADIPLLIFALVSLLITLLI
jgi:hypothetical protein